MPVFPIGKTGNGKGPGFRGSDSRADGAAGGSGPRRMLAKRGRTRFTHPNSLRSALRRVGAFSSSHRPGMSTDNTPKTHHPVDSFSVKVLGGTFRVNELLLGENESSQQVSAAITTTPEERWFVMVAEESEENRDALAVIDDQMEFQLMAYGVLVPD